MELDTASLIAAANNTKIGISRAFAIEALAIRAMSKFDLLDEACKAISSEKTIGFHFGMPAGWLGADAIFLAAQKIPMQRLLDEMNSWTANEQQDLVRHWAGRGSDEQMTIDFKREYNWQPRYE